MSSLYFYDDVRARQFEPFALTRPVSELRAGTSLIRKRWERATSFSSAGFIGSTHLANFEEGSAPPAVAAKSEIPAGSIIVNSRCVVPLDVRLDRFDLLMCDGMAAAVRLARSMPVSQFADGSIDIGSIQTSLGGKKIKGRWVNDVWDLVGSLTEQLIEDIPHRAETLTLRAPLDVTVVGKEKVYIEEGAEIGPQVVLDASVGPILIRKGAVIAPFTHLVGPIAIGRDSQVLGDKVVGSSIGDHCKIRGEFSNTIVLGHSNKGHAGFVGHSYLGRWVNLGAMTTTSNLKNTYGPVQLWTPSGLRDTGQQFLGTFFGDHAKTGIGTMLSTGSVIGAGANVFGAKMPPRVVPPFAWGDAEPYETYDVTRFLVVAERVMSRRHVKLSDKARKQLGEAHKRRWSS
ncbi:MAG: UDP-N-acetylglucosamine diphosphorylase / glucose-phosphate thymidylyltransferase [Gemmatimonadaceae bacterium]|jgi:UDP-N-acetylglucosamine diphosphorylase/glucosamine-1-phosphate N-acetyltransferase|nr:UDP-N-acetylglucosamine diphosphorylase / glucose-phosphate thymidylyltransferase [Gemmatimonadaceae bacterium]